MNSPLIVLTFLLFFSSNLASPVMRYNKECTCPYFTEAYSEEGPNSIDLYAIITPVTNVDYRNSCSNVKVICTSTDKNWDSDSWAKYNGTMTTMIAATSRILCDKESSTWQVEMKNGEREICNDVSVYCQSYRAR